MSEDAKTLKTRIKLLYKPWSEWQAIATTFVPLKGEVCIAQIPVGGTETGKATQLPATMIKVGQWDGIEGSSSAVTFGNLPWLSALSADNYDWSKKSTLDWADISEEFKQEIKDLVGGEEKDTQYRIKADPLVANKWQLQKSVDNGTTWTDAEGLIDLSATITALQASIATKVDKEVSGTNGKAYIFNEGDGGGAKFVHTDKTEAFVGVNDGGESGLMAQIYADKLVGGSWVGSRINVYHDGIYYVSKANQAAGFVKNAPEMEIATKKDIQDLGQALHFVGIATKKEGETEIQAVERTFPAAQQKAGAVAICGNKEFICCGDPLAWYEFGDVSAYATKAELQAEASARATADEGLQTAITAEETRAKAAEDALDVRVGNLELPKEPAVVVDGDKTYLYANGASIRIEDNATENIAYYCTAEGVQKSIKFPYGAIVHGGGLGTSAKFANYQSSLVIMNGGKVKSIYGGSRAYGSVGVATVVVNNGQLSEGVLGGGAAPNANELNTVGLANITLNGGSSLVIYGGGMGLSTVGKVNMLINGGTHQWVTAGGSNGTTGSADVKVTGGVITCLQAVNRGVIQDATITISGGTITSAYGGGETSDTSVTGKCEKTIFHIETSFGGHVYKGTYGGVEDASRVSGDYIKGSISAEEAAACNLVVKAYPGLKQIAYTASTDDLVVGTEVWILDCNL